jgi:hypothetical protein
MLTNDLAAAPIWEEVVKSTYNSMPSAVNVPFEGMYSKAQPGQSNIELEAAALR